MSVHGSLSSWRKVSGSWFAERSQAIDAVNSYRNRPEAIQARLQDDRVHRDLYLSDELFTLEQERLFANPWLYVGHTCQVPNADDYWSLELAGRPVMMVRQADGVVRVLYNRCAHKGSRLVSDEGRVFANGHSVLGVNFSIHSNYAQLPEYDDQTTGGMVLRTPFIYVEAREDDQVLLAGICRDRLVRGPDGLLIRQKRIDLLNAQRALPDIQLFI